eukprot:Hpha_TRINITY_DN4938_c0_g1::TRINITY_DN4938_c0_g1_i1::g.51449::m.51449
MSKKPVRGYCPPAASSPARDRPPPNFMWEWRWEGEQGGSPPRNAGPGGQQPLRQGRGEAGRDEGSRTADHTSNAGEATGSPQPARPAVTDYIAAADSTAVGLETEGKWFDALEVRLRTLELRRQCYPPGSPEVEEGFMAVAELTLAICEEHLTNGSATDAAGYLAELEAMTSEPLTNVWVDRKRVVVRARVFLAYAALKRRQGRPRQGLRYAERATSILLKLGCRRELPHAYLNLCALHSSHGLHHEALRFAFLALRTVTDLIAEEDQEAAAKEAEEKETPPARPVDSGLQPDAPPPPIPTFPDPEERRRRKEERVERLGWGSSASKEASVLHMQCWVRQVLARWRVDKLRRLKDMSQEAQAETAERQEANSAVRNVAAPRGVPLRGLLSLCYHNVAVEQEHCGSAAATDSYRAAASAARAFLGPQHPLAQQMTGALASAAAAVIRKKRVADGPPGAGDPWEARRAQSRRRRVVQTAWGLEARRMQQKWGGKSGLKPLYTLRPARPHPGTSAPSTVIAPCDDAGVNMNQSRSKVHSPPPEPDVSEVVGSEAQEEPTHEKALAGGGSQVARRKRKGRQSPASPAVPVSDEVVRKLAVPRGAEWDSFTSSGLEANDEWLQSALSEDAVSQSRSRYGKADLDFLQSTFNLGGLTRTNLFPPSRPPSRGERYTTPATPKGSSRSRKMLEAHRLQANRWLEELRPIPGAVY